MNLVRSVKVLKKASPILSGKLTPLYLVNILVERGNSNLKTSKWFTSMAEGGSQSHITGNVEEVDGDLFSCPDFYSLAHCISADIKMGKGIAVAFKEMFGGVEELWFQGQRTGGLAILERNGRYIYYLVTKERYWNKPTYETIKASLFKMMKHNVEHGVTHLAMPEIGCGLDQLKWPQVLKCINDIYNDTDVHIRVYHYDGGQKKRQQTSGQRSSYSRHDRGRSNNGGRNAYSDGGRYSNESGRYSGSGHTHGGDVRIRSDIHYQPRSGHSHHYGEGDRREKKTEGHDDRSRERRGRESKMDGRYEQTTAHHSKQRRDVDDHHRRHHPQRSYEDVKGNDRSDAQRSHHESDNSKCDDDDSNSSLHQKIGHDDGSGDCDGNNSESQHGWKDGGEYSKERKSRDKHQRVQDRHMSGRERSKGQKNKKIQTNQIDSYFYPQ